MECIDNLIQFWMYEVQPSILESRLLGSNNIVDAAVVGIPDQENGQVSLQQPSILISTFTWAISYTQHSKRICLFIK